MADGKMRHDDDSNSHHQSDDGGHPGGNATETIIETARRELADAAADLEQLTGELHERTRLVARLEVLADALLDLVVVPALVVDSQGRIAAVSRGAASEHAELADALGKPLSAVVHQSLVAELAAFTAGTSATSTQEAALAESSTRFTALPDGSTLVVFES